MLTNKEKKANDILKILEKLYPKTPIPLSHKDPYTLLVAVVLSAQCTDERVNKITPLLFKEANNPKKMVKLGVRNIEKSLGDGCQKIIDEEIVIANKLRQHIPCLVKKSI